MSTEPKSAEAPPATPSAGASPNEEERNMAMTAHAGGILTGALLPFLIWHLKKGQSAYVDENALEALNFQLTLHPVDLVAIIIMIFAGAWGLLLWLPVLVVRIGLGIMATMNAAQGKPFRYVINARLIK
jgi:uncharacterized Tic20 family protein